MRNRLVLAIAGLLASSTALAGPSPQTGSFNVTANVANSCRITATPDLAFGAYDPADANFSTALDAASSISVRCTKGTNAAVALGQGGNPASGSTCAAPLRQMAAGAERLRYDLYQDSGRTQVWGCDASNDRDFTSTSSVTATTLNTYGRIPAGQDVAAGNYTDTVTVTVTF
ncbi:Csu type fimbrial protein [Vulcaniibacterium gelatinicum]|uniref:Csu type fimbrial protein n=1 Tax=Vulcaniibacterium gelatinicum TaxID=2598725 RepID=UPI0015F2D5A8|nr:spore coat U domain-containing protein [Vulcaniibacterium gelatinicum]